MNQSDLLSRNIAKALAYRNEVALGREHHNQQPMYNQPPMYNQHPMYNHPPMYNQPPYYIENNEQYAIVPNNYRPCPCPTP